MDKSIQTEKTHWEIQIEENSKNELLKITELNEEKLQHRITKKARIHNLSKKYRKKTILWRKIKIQKERKIHKYEKYN